MTTEKERSYRGDEGTETILTAKEVSEMEVMETPTTVSSNKKETKT